MGHSGLPSQSPTRQTSIMQARTVLEAGLGRALHPFGRWAFVPVAAFLLLYAGALLRDGGAWLQLDAAPGVPAPWPWEAAAWTTCGLILEAGLYAFFAAGWFRRAEGRGTLPSRGAWGARVATGVGTGLWGATAPWIPYSGFTVLWVSGRDLAVWGAVASVLVGLGGTAWALWRLPAWLLTWAFAFGDGLPWRTARLKAASRVRGHRGPMLASFCAWGALGAAGLQLGYALLAGLLGQEGLDPRWAEWLTAAFTHGLGASFGVWGLGMVAEWKARMAPSLG